MTAMINGANLIEGNTLIFLDEIQACGNARTALKFLAEDGKFDVITSGSLLGLTYGEDADENTEEPESVPTGYETFRLILKNFYGLKDMKMQFHI